MALQVESKQKSAVCFEFLDKFESWQFLSLGVGKLVSHNNLYPDLIPLKISLVSAFTQILS